MKHRGGLSKGLKESSLYSKLNHPTGDFCLPIKIMTDNDDNDNDDDNGDDDHDDVNDDYDDGDNDDDLIGKFCRPESRFL